MKSHFYFLFQNNVHICTFENETLEDAIKEANTSFPYAKLDRKGIGSNNFKLKGEPNIVFNVIISSVIGFLIGAVFALYF